MAFDGENEDPVEQDLDGDGVPDDIDPEIAEPVVTALAEAQPDPTPDATPDSNVSLDNFGTEADDTSADFDSEL